MWIVYYREDGRFLVRERYVFSRYPGIGDPFMRNRAWYESVAMIVIGTTIHLKIRRVTTWRR